MVARTITNSILSIRRILPGKFPRKCGLCREKEKAGDLRINSCFVFCARCQDEYLLTDRERQVSVKIPCRDEHQIQDNFSCSEAGEIQIAVLCLLAYRGRVRDLILLAKAAGHYQANIFLPALFTRLLEMTLPYRSAELTAIYVAPQSMWGRFRQKIHLAALLAESFAARHHSQHKLVRGGRPLRWHKQSRQSDRQRHFEETKLPLAPGPLTVVIDDILTSGETMTLIMQHLQQNSCKTGQLLGLCLARA